LYQSEDFARVEFADYTATLMKDLVQIYAKVRPAVQLRLDLKPTVLPVDVAVPFGLIVNELATNALKHAFGNRDAGEISIQLRTDDSGNVHFRFTDNGVGLAQPLSWSKVNSFGLRLVSMLAQQIGAQIEVQSEQGTSFHLSFETVPAQPESVPKAVAL
jgi:two-component sensor histidine kinase